MKITIEGTREEIRKVCPNFRELFSIKINIGDVESSFRPTKMTLWDEDTDYRSSLVLEQIVSFKTSEEIAAEQAVKAAEESLKKAKEALEAVKK